MAVTLVATAVPAPAVPGTANYMTDQYSSSGSPSTSLAQTSGNTAALVSSIMNRNATGQDMQAVYGGGAYAICSGLTLSAGMGLTCIVADGQAIVHGLVEKRAGTAGTTAVVGSSTTAWIWLMQNGSLTVQNGTTAAPTGNACLLGAAMTNASAVTAIETAGVVYLKSGLPYRETNDAAAPGDSPNAQLRLFTKTQGGTYFWNGTAHILQPTAPYRLVKAQTSVGTGDTVANTTAETVFATNYVAPANSLKVGDVLEVEARGVLSTTGTPTLELKIKAGSTVLGATGALTTGNNSANRGWYVKGAFTVASTGTAGTVEAQGDGAIYSAASTLLSADMENTAAIAIDTTQAQTVQASVTWGAASTANTVTMRSLTVRKAG